MIILIATVVVQLIPPSPEVMKSGQRYYNSISFTGTQDELNAWLQGQMSGDRYESYYIGSIYHIDTDKVKR